MKRRKFSNYFSRTDFNITFVMLAYIFLGMLLNYFRHISLLLLIVKVLLIVYSLSLVLALLFKQLNHVKLYRLSKLYLRLISVVVAPFILIGIGFCYHESSIVTKEDSHGIFTFPLKNEVYASVIQQLNLDDENVLLHFTTGLENKTIQLHKDDLHIGYYALTDNNDLLDKPKLTSPYLEINKNFRYDVLLDTDSYIIPLLTINTEDITYTLRIPLDVQAMK
ncbi:MAG TPA: hypothetical protein DCY20_01840 [Firmicutes bacterium]|nr:hypothetical protein [Bacillota bacterium]